MSVLIETTIGDLVFDLYTDERPRSCLNFLKLCKIKYYNFCLFHSVRRNFIAQSGDPTGSGRGGESIYGQINGGKSKYFDLELKPRIKHNTRGTISFVNNGNNMHGSQFFITLGDGLAFLDGKHTVFGELAEGLETLGKLNETICDDNHKPYQDVRISHTIILDDPFDDPDGLQIPDRSPEPNKEQLESGRIGAEEDIDDKGKTKEEIQRQLEDKELEIGTKILETVGDIDDADLKPPENVLFVCKLNPVTNAEDLQIIFSRFGKILSCEIIEDHKTGDSLCYGFVEFKEVEACEKAYFKMDNVLIDDRRIHVDFCQSVAKLRKWHKSSAFKKMLTEKKPARSEYQLKDQQKNRRNDSYAMVFEDDHISHVKKRRNQDEERLKRDRINTEKQETKRNESRRSQISKGKRHRYSSTSSSSTSDDEESDEKLRSGKNGRHSSKRNKKYTESESSSDEEKGRRKPEKIRKPVHSKKAGSNTRRYQDSESDSDYQRQIKAVKSKVKKSKSKYSDSDSPSRGVTRKITKYDSDSQSDDIRSKKKSHKKKVDEQRDSSSSEDRKTRKKKKTSSRSRHEDDSDDTEEYVKDETKLSKRKKSRYSSDESVGQKRRQGKVRRRSTSYEERKHSSLKKSSSSSKKSRRRKDSEYSDSSQ